MVRTAYLGPRWVSNSNMNRILPLVVDQQRKRLPQWLSELLKAGMREQDGCVFLTECAPAAGEEPPQHIQDRTGWEALVNHFHMEPTDEFLADLGIAAAAASQLADQLRELRLAFPCPGDPQQKPRRRVSELDDPVPSPWTGRALARQQPRALPA